MSHSELFHYSYQNILVDNGNIYNFKKIRQIPFFLKLIICFVNVEIDPRLC
jgi:hypothetical protein